MFMILNPEEKRLCTLEEDDMLTLRQPLWRVKEKKNNYAGDDPQFPSIISCQFRSKGSSSLAELFAVHWMKYTPRTGEKHAKHAATDQPSKQNKKTF